MNTLNGRELAMSLAANSRSHAFIIEGERGCGRRTLALQMAAAMLCENFDREHNRACGVCRSCVKVADGAHPDVDVIGAGLKLIPVDTIRDLRTAASIRPNEADCRVFIICDGQNMNAAAQNALLKVLEEPPGSVRFIITCDNRNRMLDTIVSRALPIRISGFPVDECVRLLAERFTQQSEERLQELSLMFDGNIGRCISALDEDDALDAELLALAEKAYIAAHASFGWELMELMARFEKDKDAFIRFLALLRLRCRCTGENSAEDLRRIKMTRAIDRAESDIDRNGYYPLILSAFSCALRG